jgi:prepilin-type processing-associated H-X9-DG protein
MLGVVAVAGVLGLVVVPFLRHREVQKEAQCRSNLAELSLEIQSYLETRGFVFPQGSCPNAALSPDERLSWLVEIMPYMPYHFPDVDKTVSWQAGTNNTIFSQWVLPDLWCPSHERDGWTGLAPTWYIGIAGLGADAPSLSRGHVRAGIFGHDRATTPADVTDGLASTMMLAETSQPQGSWIQGGPATVRGLDPKKPPYVGRGGQFGGNHPGGAAVAFADGSVRFVGESIDPKVFEAMSTIAGGERVDVP